MAVCIWFKTFEKLKKRPDLAKTRINRKTGHINFQSGGKFRMAWIKREIVKFSQYKSNFYETLLKTHFSYKLLFKFLSIFKF